MNRRRTRALAATLAAAAGVVQAGGDGNPPCSVILAWTHGHEGTTALARADKYECPSRRVEVRMQGQLRNRTRSTVVHKFEKNFKIPLLAHSNPACHNDTSRMRAGSRDAWMNQSAYEIHSEILPGIEKLLRVSTAEVYVDLGHQFATGCLLIDPLIEALGPALCMVRIRRQRLDVAYSLASGSHGPPCNPTQSYWWFVCRTRDAALYVDDDRWSALDPFQQHLWVTDEIEAQWQLLLLRQPQLRHFDLDWDAALEQRHFELVARLAGCAVRADADFSPTKRHVHGDAAERNASELRLRDAAYRETVEYSAEQQRLAAPRQWWSLSAAAAAGRDLE
ncbi:unnamed protein product [Phaeothamnion confervicola]